MSDQKIRITLAGLGFGAEFIPIYQNHDNAEIAVYKGATHNFAMPHKDGYHAEAAKASRAAVLKCFQQM